MIQVKSQHEPDSFESQALQDASLEIPVSGVKPFHAKFIWKSPSEGSQPYFSMASTTITQAAVQGGNSIINENQTAIKTFFEKKSQLDAKLSLKEDEILTEKMEALQSMNLDDRTLDDSEFPEGPYKTSEPLYQDLDKFKAIVNLNSLILGNHEEYFQVLNKQQEQCGDVRKFRLQSPGRDSLDFSSSSSESESSDNDNDFIKLEIPLNLIQVKEDTLIFLNESTIEKDTDEDQPSLSEMNFMIIESNINNNGNCSISSFDDIDLYNSDLISSRNHWAFN